MIANNYNGLLRYKGDRKYQTSRSGRKLSRRLLGQLENRMNIFGQQFGKFYSILEDGSTIEVFIDKRSGIPFYQARLVASIPEIVTQVGTGIWVCWPSADEAEYGWDASGTALPSFDFASGPGVTFDETGNLKDKGSTLVAGPNDWRDPGPISKIVVSWFEKGSAIYANGVEIIPDTYGPVGCACVRSMMDGGVSKNYLVWIAVGGSTHMYACEVQVDHFTGSVINVSTATGYIDASWELAINSGSLSGGFTETRFWQFSDNTDKLLFCNFDQSSCAPDQWDICTVHIGQAFECVSVPSDIASVGDILFDKIYENSDVVRSGSIVCDKKFLVKAQYDGNISVPIWCHLKRETTTESIPVPDVDLTPPANPDGVAWQGYAILCPSDGMWRFCGIGANPHIYENTYTITHTIRFQLYEDASLLTERVIGEYVQVLYSHNLVDVAFDSTPHPSPCESSPLVYDCSTLQDNGITINSDCSDLQVPGSQPYLTQTYHCRPHVFSRAWQSTVYDRYVIVSLGEGEVIGDSNPSACQGQIVESVVWDFVGAFSDSVTFSGDFGIAHGIDILKSTATDFLADNYLNSIMRDLSPIDDDTSSSGVIGEFLNVDDSNLIQCFAAYDNAGSNWVWKSRFNGSDLIPVVGISGYTDPKIVYTNPEPHPFASFGLLHKP